MNELRNALSSAATAIEAAKRAKELASDPANAAMLPELVAMLADVIITPPRARQRGRPGTASYDDALSNETKKRMIEEQTLGNIALSEYAHIVNARNIADGRALVFAMYGEKWTKEDAMRYLKDRRLGSKQLRSIKREATDYVLKLPYVSGQITPKEFELLKRKLASTRLTPINVELKSEYG